MSLFFYADRTWRASIGTTSRRRRRLGPSSRCVAIALTFPCVDIGRNHHLLVVLVSLVVDDVEELELVNTTGGGVEKTSG
jgi:hypothetical protein